MALSWWMQLTGCEGATCPPACWLRAEEARGQGREPKESHAGVTAGEAASACPPSPAQGQRQQAWGVSQGRDGKQRETKHLRQFPHNPTSQLAHFHKSATTISP